jgi:hypothetical protein
MHFQPESLILALLLSQHKLINHFKSMIKSEQTDNGDMLGRHTFLAR